MSERELCHVCKKKKKPYVVIMSNNPMSLIIHQEARKDGPICERCNNFYGLTGEFKDATEAEFEVAKEAIKFSHNVLKWWNLPKLEKENSLDDHERKWPGTDALKKWYRTEHEVKK